MDMMTFFLSVVVRSIVPGVGVVGSTGTLSIPSETKCDIRGMGTDIEMGPLGVLSGADAFAPEPGVDATAAALVDPFGAEGADGVDETETEPLAAGAAGEVSVAVFPPEACSIGSTFLGRPRARPLGVPFAFAFASGVGAAAAAGTAGFAGVAAVALALFFAKRAACCS